MLKEGRIALLLSTMFSFVFMRAYFINDHRLKTYIEQPVQPKVEGGNVIDPSHFLVNYDREGSETPSKVSTVDNALFLTPYIKRGQIKKAQDLALVKPMIKNVESFSGYLTVDKKAGSNMFFWLFKSQEGNWEERPLVIWLQGGPGSSSLFGLFTEVGPFYVTKEQKLLKREYSWNRKCNLVFFDNPVGTGFSFTNTESGYARTEIDVAKNLYEAIFQLYKLFPSLQKNQLFIAGESYAGKYIPAIAHKIYKMNQDQTSPLKIDLAGLMIGNGFTDPINQVSYATYLFQLGLIDKTARDRFLLEEDEIKADIRAGRFEEALGGSNAELNEISEVTGLKHVYDFVHDDVGGDGPEMRFVSNSSTRRAIHVGDHRFNDGWTTYGHLRNDGMQSVKPWVEELLRAEEFPIMFYSGQLDIIVAYPLGVEFYNSLKWPRAEEYHKANRCMFEVGGEVAGYYKTAGTFTEVLVRNTGHMVPTTQPKWAFELFDRFVTNSSSFKC